MILYDTHNRASVNACLQRAQHRLNSVDITFVARHVDELINCILKTLGMRDTQHTDAYKLCKYKCKFDERYISKTVQ